jgi:hypothetical protein
VGDAPVAELDEVAGAEPRSLNVVDPQATVLEPLDGAADRHERHPLGRLAQDLVREVPPMTTSASTRRDTRSSRASASSSARQCPLAKTGW